VTAGRSRSCFGHADATPVRSEALDRCFLRYYHYRAGNDTSATRSTAWLRWRSADYECLTPRTLSGGTHWLIPVYLRRATSRCRILCIPARTELVPVLLHWSPGLESQGTTRAELGASWWPNFLRSRTRIITSTYPRRSIALRKPKKNIPAQDRRGRV